MSEDGPEALPEGDSLLALAFESAGLEEDLKVGLAVEPLPFEDPLLEPASGAVEPAADGMELAEELGGELSDELPPTLPLSKPLLGLLLDGPAFAAEVASLFPEDELPAAEPVARVELGVTLLLELIVFPVTDALAVERPVAEADALSIAAVTADEESDPFSPVWLLFGCDPASDGDPALDDVLRAEERLLFEDAASPLEAGLLLCPALSPAAEETEPSRLFDIARRLPVVDGVEPLPLALPFDVPLYAGFVVLPELPEEGCPVWDPRPEDVVTSAEFEVTDDTEPPKLPFDPIPELAAVEDPLALAEGCAS